MPHTKQRTAFLLFQLEAHVRQLSSSSGESREVISKLQQDLAQVEGERKNLHNSLLTAEASLQETKAQMVKV